MILLILMINFIVIDVIVTSILTSAIMSLVFYWLIHYKHNKDSQKRVDDIVEKIKKQRIFFTSEMDELKKQLKEITDLLDSKSKKKN